MPYSGSYTAQEIRRFKLSIIVFLNIRHFSCHENSLLWRYCLPVIFLGLKIMHIWSSSNGRNGGIPCIVKHLYLGCIFCI